MNQINRYSLFLVTLLLSSIAVPSVSAESIYHEKDRSSKYELFPLLISDGTISSIDLEAYICGADSAGQLGDNCLNTNKSRLLFNYSNPLNTKGDEVVFKIRNTGAPAYVHLDINLCWLTNNQDEMMCYEKISNLYHDESAYIREFSIRSNQFFIMIDAKEGTGGDETIVKVSYSDITSSNDDRIEPEVISPGNTYNRKVCDSQCDDDSPDPVDIFVFEAFAGDEVELNIWARSCEWFNDEKVKLYWRSEYDIANYTTSRWFTLDESGCDSDFSMITIKGEVFHSGLIYFYFIAPGVEVDHSATSYSIKFSSHDITNRDPNADLDGDGHPDISEKECNTDYQDKSKSPSDYDSDGDCDYLDSDDDDDGFTDITDKCHYSPIGEVDTDFDGCTNSEDDDDDGDGVMDEDDAFPLDSSESMDSDLDGVGDNSDAFPFDPNETTDSDYDGVGDNSDAFPFDPNETTDSDYDGVGDHTDAFPYDYTQYLDSDNDGFGDNGYSSTGDDCPYIFGSSYLYLNGCLDADNDGYPDSYEIECYSNYTDASIIPLDSNYDGICNVLDSDENIEWASQISSEINEDEDFFTELLSGFLGVIVFLGIVVVAFCVLAGVIYAPVAVLRNLSNKRQQPVKYGEDHLMQDVVRPIRNQALRPDFEQPARNHIRPAANIAKYAEEEREITFIDISGNSNKFKPRRGETLHDMALRVGYGPKDGTSIKIKKVGDRKNHSKSIASKMDGGTFEVIPELPNYAGFNL